MLSYLSPSSLNMWIRNPQEFYTKYVVGGPREPQNRYMAVGSSFDAYVKGHLSKRFLGRDTTEELFESQVEAQNRDASRVVGKRLYDAYVRLGCLTDLIEEMASGTDHRFEFTVSGTVNGEVGGVVLLGKPDVYYLNKEGVPVILDFKVNSNASPKPGYVRLRPGGKPHKDATLIRHLGGMINGRKPLELVSEDWARQLSIYGWLVGSGPFLTSIDQVIYTEDSVRVAEHRAIVGKAFQDETYAKACELWEILKSGHFFRDRSPEESRALEEALHDLRFWQMAN